MSSERADRGRTRGQRGESLLESMLGIMILSVIVAASYGGLQVAMRSSVQQQEMAVAGALLRNSAEMLLDPSTPYIDRAGCKGEDRYEDLPSEPGYGEVALEVTFLEPGPVAVPSATKRGSRCPESDPGLQEMTLTVTTPSGSIQSLQIVRRRP